MLGSQVISDDILDIGNRRAEERRGGASLCPPSLCLGEPSAFDVPNVPDVSSNSNTLEAMLLYK